MGKTRKRKSNNYVEEWAQLLPGSLNATSENDHDFRDPYMYYRDAIYPYKNGYELFMFFYNNRFKKPLVSNPWRRTLVKLIFLEVYVDVDLLKDLIASYNPAKKSFHKQDRSVLCTLDHASFIESVGLEGQMSVEVDI